VNLGPAPGPDGSGRKSGSVLGGIPGGNSEIEGLKSGRTALQYKDKQGRDVLKGYKGKGTGDHLKKRRWAPRKQTRNSKGLEVIPTGGRKRIDGKYSTGYW